MYYLYTVYLSYDIHIYVPIDRHVDIYSHPRGKLPSIMFTLQTLHADFLFSRQYKLLVISHLSLATSRSEFLLIFSSRTNHGEHFVMNYLLSLLCTTVVIQLWNFKNILKRFFVKNKYFFLLKVTVNDDKYISCEITTFREIFSLDYPRDLKKLQ